MSIIKSIGKIFAESLYLMKQRGKIRESTIYLNCDKINIPAGLKRVGTPVNANYIVTDRAIFEGFIKKAGQVMIVVCNSERETFFAEIQHTMLMADYLLCPENISPEQLLDAFEINGIFKGCTVSGYGKEVIENIISGKYKSNYRKEKKRVLIYSGSLAQNGLTSSLLNLLAFLKNDEENEYIITYREQSVRKFPEHIEKLPDCYRKLPMSGGFCYSVTELLCYIMYFKFKISWGFVNRRVERLFKREWQRYFGMADFDTAVQFTGYEYGVIKMFQQFSGNRVIFVHNDMVSEIKQRGNQHFLTLREAYREYDKVAVVTEDMIKSALEISGTEKNIVVVPNCHDYKSVLERSRMPIEFQEETECSVPFKILLNTLDDPEIVKFITIGRFSPEKAHFRLIDAFEEYCNKHIGEKNCLIIIGGRGELYQRTVEYAAKTGLDIIVIRSMLNPMPVLAKCDLFMLPSEYEGLGLVLLEADTLGVPVFATDIPGPSCFLREYGGCLVENSHEGIISGMELYREGKIKRMNIDFEEYNKKAVEKFRKIVKNNRK